MKRMTFVIINVSEKIFTTPLFLSHLKLFYDYHSNSSVIWCNVSHSTKSTFHYMSLKT